MPEVTDQGHNEYAANKVPAGTAEAIGADQTGKDLPEVVESFDSDDFPDGVDGHLSALWELVTPLRDALATTTWDELGVNGLVNLFDTVPRRHLEKFLRDFRTPAPRRPGRADAQVVLRKARHEGPARILEVLDHLGTGLITEAYALVDEGESAEWRVEHPDSVIRAAAVGEMFTTPMRTARAITTLAEFGLLPEVLIEIPAIIGHAKTVTDSLAELANRSTEADASDHHETEACDPEDWISVEEITSVEELAAGLLDTQGNELEELDRLIGETIERYDEGSGAARSFAMSLEAAEFPDPDALVAVHAVIETLGSLVRAIQPTIDHLGLPGLPSLQLLEDAAIMARQTGHKPAHEPRMAALSGPIALEEKLGLLRSAAKEHGAALLPFIKVLEALIDAATLEDVDHQVLHDLEATARSFDPEGRFAAVLIAAVRGALTLPSEESASAEDFPADEAAPPVVPAASPPDMAASVANTVLPKSSGSAPGDVTPSEESGAAPGIEAQPEECQPMAGIAVNAPETAKAIPERAVTALGTAALRTSQPEPAGEVVERFDDRIAGAIDDGLFGIAAWTADAVGEPSALLHLATLARAIRGPRGPLVDALGAAQLELVDGISGGRAYQLACWASALQASVLAPASGICELAERLVPMIDVSGAEALTEAVVHFARRNVSLAGTALNTVGDLAALGEAIGGCATAVKTALQERRYRFAVASAIWIDWIHPRGALSVLSPAADDDRSKVADVRSAAKGLSDRRTMERELADAERRVRMKSSTKRIEGSARQSLLSHAAEAVTAALSWCDAIEALAARQRRSSGADDEVVSGLHQAANRVREDLFAGLEDAGPGSRGARLVLDDLYALMSGTPLTGVEMSPQLTRHEALLYGDQAVGIDLEPLGPLEPAALLIGSAQTLGDAFTCRLARRDFVAAHALIDVAKATNPDAEADLTRTYTQALSEARALVREQGSATSRILDRARRQLYVTEDVYAAMSGRLARATDTTRLDVDRELSELEAFVPELDAAKEQRVALFREEVVGLCVSHPDFATRVNALIEAGDLATATELRQLVEQGEDLAEADREAFAIASFFPAVAGALANGIDDAVLTAVAERGIVGPLDFSPLNDAAAASVVEAFDAWRRFASGPPLAKVLDLIKPVLRLMGIEAGAEERRATSSIPSSPQRRWFDLTKVTLTGKALLPFFGSTSAGRLRCVWVIGSPAPETLCEWIEQDSADHPVMVLHPGTMLPETRLAVTRIMRQRNTQPAIVVDDAVLVWLGSQGQFRFEPLMGATLPFSAGNPYLPPSGDCPVEMFYGRSTQVAAVQARDGTCLVYGGRQLGKSALLRTAQREFNRVPSHVAIYVDLKAPVEATHKADAVWAELVSKLTQAGIMQPTRSVPKDPAAAVTAAVNDWLDAHEMGRILVLLDETDQYFDLDAQTNFVTTSRLKDLMDAKGRRFKVVWTGLHQVRRFATVSNHPIAHLGVPAVIGYLEPGPAYRLIEKPCAALGLHFESDALVNRVLAYCNYQPVLLHLFSRALVERLCIKGASTLRTVPIEVHETDVEAVADSPSLQEAVREKLRLTLELDPRYKVITYTTAYEAYSRGQAVALSAPELEAMAKRWWPAGFATVDASEFRSLLEELVDLGVLSADPDGRGWRLRSANVLRLLGTLEQVEDTLLEEEVREPTVLETSEIRDRLHNAGRSPITRAQLGDLIGTGSNQIRLIVGSEAACADRLAGALAQAEDETPHRFTYANPKTKAQYKKALEVGGTDLPRLVFSDLRAASIEACAESLELARGVLPWNGTRSVALLVDASTMSWWMPFAAPEGPGEGVGLVSLRRFDRRGARAWASVYEDVFQDEDSRRQLLEITGGWPALFERADVSIVEASGGAKTAASTAAVLAALRDQLSQAVETDELLVSILAGAPAVVTDVFSLLAENMAETMTPEDLVTSVEGECADPDALVGALRALGVLQVADRGELGAEAVLARAWMRSRVSPSI